MPKGKLPAGLAKYQFKKKGVPKKSPSAKPVAAKPGRKVVKGAKLGGK